jgi:hypothetical protein
MGRVLALASTMVLVLGVSVSAATAAQATTTVERPSVATVKRGLVRFWDTDQENSVDKITLVFRSVKLLPTRRSIPATDVVEGDWVTAVFDQRTVRTSTDILNGGATIRSCYVYRVSFVGIFWKGDLGWAFKNRNTKTKLVSSRYRC